MIYHFREISHFQVHGPYSVARTHPIISQLFPGFHGFSPVVPYFIAISCQFFHKHSQSYGLYVYIYIYIYIYISISLYLSVCLSIYLSVCLSVYLSISLSLYIYIYIYMTFAMEAPFTYRGSFQVSIVLYNYRSLQHSLSFITT